MPCRNSLDHKDNWRDNRSCKDEEQRLQCGIEVLKGPNNDTGYKVVKRYSEGESKY